jgi:xanthine dehydrogenase accessory factor
MPLFQLFKEYLKKDQGVTLATVVRGPEALLGQKALIPADAPAVGPLLDSPLAADIIKEAQQLMVQRTSATHHYSLPTDAAGIEVFFDVHTPAPRLIIVGAVHIAVDLIYYAKPLGLRTYLVDPRTAFATAERFPHVDVMLPAWPDEALPEIGLTAETSVVVVTHDPKLDDPALKIVLPSPAQYIGALGSPKTHAKRLERLLAEGVAPEHLQRLHAPIGLNIGGRTPAEIALSIIAEIVAVRNGIPVADREPRHN